MKFAKGDLPVVTRLIIEDETSPGSTTPLLQHFPALLIPRVGDKVTVGGLEGEFRVSEVTYNFHAQDEQNIQGVIVIVKKI